MGLFEKIFPSGKNIVPVGKDNGFFQTFTAYSPMFRTWNGQLYESELVRAAVDATARHVSKLKIEIKGSAKPKLKRRLEVAPNTFQTWSQFLYRLSVILDMQNTAFIVPTFDEYGEICGLFPLLPSTCELVQYGQEPWLRYTFADGKKASIRLAECGIMTRHQYQDDFFGGSRSALDNTIKLMDLQAQAINEAVTNSNSFRFMARVANFTKPEDLSKERKRFTDENLRSDGGGVLLFPSTYSDIKQLESKSYVVDSQQAEAIRTNVFNYFGTNLSIIQNSAYGDAWNAFYEGRIEWFAIQFSEVVSKMLFSELERGRGNEIFASANRLQYLSNADKLAISSQMLDRGIMNRNEIRAIWNLPPIDGDEGNAYVMLAEYVNAKDQEQSKEGDGDEENDRS